MSAILLSIALVLRVVFSFDLPLFGQNGLRIGLSGIFSVMPSILFGPIYGAVVSGLSDVFGYVLKPTGPYLFPLTITAILGGFIRGSLWLFLRKKDGKKIRITVAIFVIILLVTGVLNFSFLAADNIDSSYYDRVEIEDINTENMHHISRLVVTRTMNTSNPASNLSAYIIITTWALVGSALFGLILLAAEMLLSRKSTTDGRERHIMPLLAAMVTSGVIITTLNTIFLREMIYTSWKVLPFFVIWIPRLIEEILSNTIYVYFVAILLEAVKRQKNMDFLK